MTRTLHIFFALVIVYVNQIAIENDFYISVLYITVDILGNRFDLFDLTRI